MKKLATIIVVSLGFGILVPNASADMLRVGVTALPTARFNPWASPNIPSVFLVSAMFDGLTRLDASGAPKPWLATSWTSKNAKNWRFELREDVLFSSGRKMTAMDVVAALDYLTGPLTMREVLASEFAHVSAARAVDDYTVEIELRSPDIIFPRTVSQLMIPDSFAWTELGPDQFALSPVGTGPFKLDHLTNEKVSFSAFQESWRPPLLANIEALVLIEPSTRLNGLLSDRLDIAFDMSRDDVDTINLGGGTLYQARLPAVLGLILISTRPDSPLYLKEVRQALNYAVDVEAVAQMVFGSSDLAASQSAPRVAFGYNPSLRPYGFDPDKARALLAQAGFEDGFSFAAEIVLSGPSDAIVFQKIASDLKQIGVELTLKTVTYPIFGAQVRNGEWSGDAFNMMFSTEPSLDALRGIKYHSCAWPGLWYCDDTITSTIDAAASSQDLSRRRSLTQSVMERYREQAPAIFLYELPYQFGLSASVRDFTVVNSFIPWHEVSLLQ